MGVVKRPHVRVTGFIFVPRGPSARLRQCAHVRRSHESWPDDRSGSACDWKDAPAPIPGACARASAGLEGGWLRKESGLSPPARFGPALRDIHFREQTFVNVFATTVADVDKHVPAIAEYIRGVRVERNALAAVSSRFRGSVRHSGGRWRTLTAPSSKRAGGSSRIPVAEPSSTRHDARISQPKIHR